MLPFQSLVQLALGIGLCEDVSTTYRIKMVAPESGLIAFDVETGWCEETDTGEARGAMKSVLVADFDTRGKAHYYTADADNKGRQPEGTVRPAADWPAFAKEKGFREVGAAGLFLDAGACGAKLVNAKGGALPNPEEADPMKALGLALAITTPSGELAPIRIGMHVLGEGAPEVVISGVPGKAALRVFTVTAKCEGGPPAGYFGEDDPGDCYAGWVRRKVDLSVKKYPGLEACLKKP